MKEAELLRELHRARVFAVLRTTSQEGARSAMRAALRGGIRIAEFTLNTPGAIDLIREFSSSGEAIVGAGTVLTPEDARDAKAAGAAFLVTPVLDPKVIEEAIRLGLPIAPGCHTPTEMWRAYQAGAALQKLFPAGPGGPDYLKACLGPMPFLRLVPTHGVTPENVADYLRAGAFAVGLVNSLFVPDDIANQRWEKIEARARAAVRAVSD
jgi:Entner-Doudoroff aldolase